MYSREKRTSCRASSAREKSTYLLGRQMARERDSTQIGVVDRTTTCKFSSKTNCYNIVIILIFSFVLRRGITE